MTRSGYGTHSFLNEYIRKNQVQKIMEIGVHNGRNARQMVEVAKESISPEEIEYYGFDYFKNERRMEEAKDNLSKTGCIFSLFKGGSADVLPSVVDNLPRMDVIFIDGGHDYETINSDWENSRKLMKEDTAVFFHNYNYGGTKKVIESILTDIFAVDVFSPSGDYKSVLVKKK